MMVAGMRRWYAVSCKPRQEAVAEENLLRQGYQVYLPRISVRKRQRGHWRTTIEALFPRYAFVRLNLMQQNSMPIRSTRGAVGLVRFGGEAAVVPDHIVMALQAREEGASGLHSPELQRFERGEPIRMVEGPLTGIEGVFSEPDGDLRVIVMLELLGKANSIKVSRDWIARAA